MKENIYSIRLTDQHTELLKKSSTLNKCSKAKIVEDALNDYFKIDNELKRI